MAKRFKKILVLAVIFTMTLVNYGLPLKAIASEGESFFSFAFFKKNEISLDAYFADDSNSLEETANVNETAKITLEVSPQIEGYLKSGTLKFNLKNGNENNFKLQSVTIEEKEKFTFDVIDSEKLEGVKKLDKTEDATEDIQDVVSEEPVANEVKAEKAVDVNEVTDKNPFSGLFKTDTAKESSEENKVDSEKVDLKTENTVQSENVVAENTVSNESVEPEDAKDETVSDVTEKEPENKEELEEKDISEIIEDVKGTYEVSLVNENEIALKNIIESTKIFVEVGYKQLNKVNPEDIFSEIEIVLNGNYINKKLETVEVNRKQYLNLGWEYSKELEVTSDFTKVSPFTVGQNSGTIIENVITIARNIEDTNFLPIKETNIKIEIPKINDKLPIAVNVAANKLMATLGKDLTGKEFNKNNWSYDEETGILEIKVINKESIAGNGEDKFDIICRYEDYLEEENITLDKKLSVKVEEYSSNKNNIQEIQIEELQEKEVIAGELMSYAIIENEELIGKGRINANYYVEAGETRFTSAVNVTVLTSDILDEVVIEPVKELYKIGEETEFDATQDVMYAGVRFNLAEIKEMLEQGSTIDLLDAEGNVFHTITKDVDATKIEFAHKIDSLKVRINNVKVNGNLSIEFIKAIDKSQYSQAEFVLFEKIENTYKAEVKYVGFEEVFQLPEVKEEIKFTDTITQVNLLMNTSSLSTVYLNENVEFKIDLLNNIETSDLYKNPSFELVFPSFVKEVTINNVYTLYQNGLSIRDYNVVDVNGLKRIVVNLDGIQSGFNFSNITNGTNLIINANIRVDEITPQKQDQIELYYCNEAATSYQTQASWNMTRNLPENSLKDTNGYDATTFEYQAPSGMVTINSITNYDGSGETIKSINQGEIIKTIPIKGENQIATMELSVLNNTGNDCSDVVLLGRIPFKGNKDVATGADLGTNVDTIMKSGLIADELNSNNVAIYYSSNPNADRDLNNEVNGWSSTYAVFDNVKSFMIVVDGPLVAGGILKYRYDFEIPANLGYEVKMIGSFGAFYNDFNVLKASVADKVGLLTEAGAKYETTMSVDIGEGAEIGEARYLTYRVQVKNTGSIDLHNIKIVIPRPAYGMFCKKSNAPDTGNDGYVTSNAKEMSFEISEIKVGGVAEKEFLVKTAEIPETLEEYASFNPNILKDDKGYYSTTEDNQKNYVTELPKDIYIEANAEVYVNDTLNSVKTNTVKNKLKHSAFDIQTTLFKTTETLESGNGFIYVVDLHNISGNTINNIVIEDVLAKELSYLGLEEISTYYENEYDKETNKVTVYANTVEPLGTIRFYIQCNIANMKNIGKADISNQIIVNADEIEEERSTVIHSTLIGPELIATQEITNGKDSVLEMEEFEIVINVNNKGEGKSRELNFDVNIPKELKILTILSDGARPITYETVENNIKGNLLLLEEHNSVSLIIKVQANPLGEGETNRHIEIVSKVTEEYIGEIEINSLEYVINDDPDRGLTQEEQDKIDKDNTIENPTAGDDYKQDIENDKNNNTNNDTNNNTNNQDNNSSNSNSNINNDNSQDNTNNQQQDNNSEGNEEINQEEPVAEIKTFKITGQVFKDSNKNNAKDSNEEGINKVQVILYEGSQKIKTTLTDSLGKYRFTEIESGDYTVVFNYDSDIYIASKYKYSNVAESMNSDAIESDEGVAVTENIRLNESDMEIDLGLQERNYFDMTVQKYISKAIVTRKGKEKVETYNNDTIAKLEIRSKELADTSIKLEYRIVVTNEGDVNGTVGTVYDYLPSSLTFDKGSNKGWELTSDNVLVNESLNKEIIKPGESKELKLVLNKVMTNDNTGTISNKVQIDNLSTDKTVDENKENNIATQEIIITISTGRTVSLVVFVVMIIMATVVIYGIKTGKIKKAYK